jgi:protocatechuate 3,4-dioxygenase beta subunit
MKTRKLYGHQVGRAAALLLLCAFALRGFQTTESTANPAASKASIKGKVLDAGTGTPVKDATLLLARDNSTGSFASTKSNEEGDFTFKDIDAGSYAIIGQHPRYAMQTYGSRSGLMGATMLTLVAGQEMKDIVFKLLPNGVVSGKVLDPDGEPVAKVMVAAMRGIYQHGKRDYVPLSTAVTNDLGEYRLSNLAPGRYIISALPLEPGAGPKPAEGEPETALVQSYYPNAPDPASAAPVDLAAGADSSGIDIRLGKARSVSVKGKVVGDVKEQNVTIRLVPKTGGLLASLLGPRSQVKRPEGTFEIKNVTRGSYTLRAGDQTGMKLLGLGVPLEIGDKPVEGVVMELGTNADLAGIVTIEGTDAKPVNGVPLKGARVYLDAMSGFNAMPPNATLAEEGTFTLKELPPEKYMLRLVSGPENAYVESVRLAGQTMGEQGLDMAGGRGRLEVKLRLGAAEVAGVVHNKDDEPMPGVMVVLLPDNGQYLLYQPTFTDQNGTFRLKSVTPGEYKILAWEDVEPGIYTDPEFVKPFLGRAERVSLKDNDHKSVTLKSIPK